MTIKEGQKWIAIQDTNIFGNLGEVISHFNEVDMLTIMFIVITDNFVNNYWLIFDSDMKIYSDKEIKYVKIITSTNKTLIINR